MSIGVSKSLRYGNIWGSQMYKYVVTFSEGKVSVEEIIRGETQTVVTNKKWYKTIEYLPEDIKNKVKQMKWLALSDADFHEGLGTRVGANIFWVV